MSNISTFKGGGSSGAEVGDFVSGVVTYWNDNPTISSKEYLRTGLLKPYSSTYSTLLTKIKSLGVVNCNAPAITWINRPNTFPLGCSAPTLYPVNFAYAVTKANTNYHFVILSDTLPNNNIKYGTSFSSAPSNTGFQNSTVHIDAITFNAKSLLISTSGTSYINVKHANSTTYANSFDFVTGSIYRHLISNTSHAFCIRSDSIGATLGHIVSSPDGYTWTNVTPSISMTTVRRAAFANSVNLNIYANATGNVWSSNNGYTLTSVGIPTNMPTTIPEIRYGNSMWVASSPNSTFISVGSGKLLKVNSGPTYTVVDLTTLSLTPDNPFTTYSMPRIVYDGTRFILIEDFYNSKYFYSTDEGLTWTRDFVLYSANSDYRSHFVNYGMNYVDSKLFISLGDSTTFNVAPFDATVNVAQSTPNYIGTFDEYSDDAYISTYIRIA